LMAAALKSRDLMSRHLLVGGFCDHLHSWQSRYAMQHGKFPPFFEWPSRLKEAVQQNRIESKRQSQS